MTGTDIAVAFTSFAACAWTSRWSPTTGFFYRWAPLIFLIPAAWATFHGVAFSVPDRLNLLLTISGSLLLLADAYLKFHDGNDPDRG